MNRNRSGEAASIVAVLSATALVVLDAGMVNVALPTIGKALAAAPADTILAVTAYQTALVMGLLPCLCCGVLSQVRGQPRSSLLPLASD